MEVICVWCVSMLPLPYLQKSRDRSYAKTNWNYPPSRHMKLTQMLESLHFCSWMVLKISGPTTVRRRSSWLHYVYRIDSIVLYICSITWGDMWVCYSRAVGVLLCYVYYIDNFDLYQGSISLIYGKSWNVLSWYAMLAYTPHQNSSSSFFCSEFPSCSSSTEPQNKSGASRNEGTPQKFNELIPKIGHMKKAGRRSHHHLDFWNQVTSPPDFAWSFLNAELILRRGALRFSASGRWFFASSSVGKNHYIDESINSFPK